MSILEQVLALGAQLTPEERQLVVDAWQAPLPEEGVAAGRLSPETARLLDEAMARYERGDAHLVPAEEVHQRLRAQFGQ